VAIRPLSATAPHDVLKAIRDLPLWDPGVAEDFLPTLLALDENQRRSLVVDVGELFEEADAEVRWHAAIVIEFLVQWDPLEVPPQLLERMSSDKSFSVRSSAAVSYYWLAGSSPDVVPVETLARLASHLEDWYVATPAVNALVRLAKTRRAAVEALAQGLDNSESAAQRHAAEGLDKVLSVEPASLLDTIKDRLLTSSDEYAQSVGRKWEAELEKRHTNHQLLTFYMF